MSYQQLHLGKVKLNGLAGIQHHLLDRNRVKTNPSIDLARSHLNHSIEDLSPENLPTRVRQRIKQLHLKRKPRSDAVGLNDIIVGASSDFMLQLGTEKREQYFSDALHFFQARYGKENVMYCFCHLDEFNPHIHIGLLPVTSDGRLSARDLFNPKSLENLQTDFYRQVSQKYGLERGQSHTHNYLELNQFKAQQAKKELQQFTQDLDSSLLQQDEIDKILQSAHFVSSGFIFKSEDKDKSELDTQKLLKLKHIAEHGVKANAQNLILSEQNKALHHENLVLKSDYDLLDHQLKKLDKDTRLYSAIPKFWRQKYVDTDIDHQQATFTGYCHDLNRAILRVFLATNGNFHQTENILHDFIKSTGVKNIEKHISDTIRVALRQNKKSLQPTIPPPSWKPPKPDETDYSKSDETTIVQLQLSKIPDIDWNLINWELLSELDKDEIRHKQETFSR